MDIYKSKAYIIPTDIVIFAYLLLTSIYMLLFHDEIENLGAILSSRLWIVFVMVQLIVIRKLSHNHWIKILHYFFPVVLMIYLYGETSQLNHALIKENLDPYFVELDQKMFGFQPSILFSQYFSNKLFSEFMYFTYITYYIQTMGIALMIFIKEKTAFVKNVFIIITGFLIYYFTFAILPVVGPQYFFEGMDGKPPESGFLSEFMHWIAKDYEKPTGAFPSSHVGMTLVFAYMAFKYYKPVFYIIAPFSFLILFSTVYIRAHYAIDVLAGIISAPIVYWMSLKLYVLIENGIYRKWIPKL